MNLKYQNEINKYVSLGAELPALHLIVNKESFRYVFADEIRTIFHHTNYILID